MPHFTTPLGHSECPTECDRGATNQQTDSHYELSFSLGSVCLRLFYSWRPAADERPHSSDCQLLPVTRFAADLRNRGQTAGTHFIAQKKRELRVTKLNLSVPLEAKPSHPSRRDSSCPVLRWVSLSGSCPRCWNEDRQPVVWELRGLHGFFLLILIIHFIAPPAPHPLTTTTTHGLCFPYGLFLRFSIQCLT